MKLHAPEGCTSISINGVEVQIVNGIVEVTEAESVELKSHGFTVEPEVKRGRPRKDEK